VRREPDPTDGRFINAVLRPAGRAKLEVTAPGHVAYVRRLVIDNLSGEHLRRLGQDAERILQRIDSRTPARSSESWRLSAASEPRRLQTVGKSR
jgi:hypothetical protein